MPHLSKGSTQEDKESGSTWVVGAESEGVDFYVNASGHKDVLVRQYRYESSPSTPSSWMLILFSLPFFQPEAW